MTYGQGVEYVIDEAGDFTLIGPRVRTIIDYGVYEKGADVAVMRFTSLAEAQAFLRDRSGT